MEAIIGSHLSKCRVGLHLVVGCKYVIGENYVPYCTPSTKSMETWNQKMQFCDGELVVKPGQDYIPPDVVVTPNKIHFVDRHFERKAKLARSVFSKYISNDRIKVWHFP